VTWASNEISEVLLRSETLVPYDTTERGVEARSVSERMWTSRLAKRASAATRERF